MQCRRYRQTRVWSPGRDNPLEVGMATHSTILAWEISWWEEPGGLQSMGLQRVRHDWSDWACRHARTCMYVWCICWVVWEFINCELSRTSVGYILSSRPLLFKHSSHPLLPSCRKHVFVFSLRLLTSFLKACLNPFMFIHLEFAVLDTASFTVF